MIRGFCIILLCIWGISAQNNLRPHINCMQTSAANISRSVPHLQLQFSTFQNDLNRLLNDLDACMSDVACIQQVELETDNIYFRFVVNELILDVAGFVAAEELDDSVFVCSENRLTSVLPIRTDTPLWCFFSAMVDLQRRNGSDSIIQSATFQSRINMNYFRECVSNQECIDQYITTGDSIYFIFIADLLSILPNGPQSAQRANAIVSRCIGNHQTRVKQLLQSPIMCYHTAATDIFSRFPNLATAVEQFLRNLRDAMTDFWSCESDSICLQNVGGTGRNANDQFFDQIRSETNGPEAIEFASAQIDRCVQGGQDNGQGSTTTPTPPLQANSTLQCFQAAVRYVGQFYQHLSRLPYVQRALSNLRIADSYGQNCTSNLVCRTNVEATANNIYFDLFTDLLLETQGIEAANQSYIIFSNCNGRHDIRVTPMIKSMLWCYHLGAAKASRIYPQLNFYTQDFVRELQKLFVEFARCEYDTDCRNFIISLTPFTYQRFMYNAANHPDVDLGDINEVINLCGNRLS